MFIDHNLTRCDGGFKQIGFNERFDRLLAAKRGSFIAEKSTWAEVVAFSERGRQQIGQLASTETLSRLRKHNPSIFQTVRDAKSRRVVGFSAQLPLTEEGVAALIEDRLDRLSPPNEFVATDNQRVEAIYVWFTYSPKSFVAVTAALSGFVDKYAAEGCSLFCVPASDEADRLFRKSGYEPARLDYPQAPSKLLVAHPRAAPKTVAPNPVRVELARTLGDMAQIIAIRAATYISEQECPYDEEFDGNDLCAAHFIGFVRGEPAGCIRIRFFSSFIKLERLAVRREFRSSTLAVRLVREAMRYASGKGYTRVYGHARSDLVRFWERFGLKRMPDRPSFTFSDVSYFEMEGPLSSTGNAVSIGDDPYRLIRPEGIWDQPGPLERVADPDRQSRVVARITRDRNIGASVQTERI